MLNYNRPGKGYAHNITVVILRYVIEDRLMCSCKYVELETFTHAYSF